MPEKVIGLIAISISFILLCFQHYQSQQIKKHPPEIHLGYCVKHPMSTWSKKQLDQLYKAASKMSKK